MTDPSEKQQRPLWFQLREGREGLLHPNRARRLFFEAVDNLKPDVRESLRRDVFPQFDVMLGALRERGVFEEHPDLPLGRIDEENAYGLLRRIVDMDLQGFPRETPRRVELHGHQSTAYMTVVLDQFVEWYLRAVRESDRAVEALRRTLERWADAYHIKADWVIETALRTMWLWKGVRMRPGDEGGWSIPEPVNADARHALPRDGEDDRDYVELPDLYNLTVQTRREIKAFYLERFEELLDARLDGLYALAVEHEIQTVPEESRGARDHHAEWLVRVLVCGCSFNQVATDVGKDIKTVREVVHPLAQYLGFALDLSKGGRRAGS